MPRVYSNYTQEEFEKLGEEAKTVGMSISQYQKYMTLLGITNENTFNLPLLISKMTAKLAKMKKGDTFIISALLPDEWVTLTRDQKGTLSQTFRQIRLKNPGKYEINAVLPSKANQYIVMR